MILKVYARREYFERRRRSPLGGSGGMLPQKRLKFRVSEMPFPAFSGRVVQYTGTVTDCETMVSVCRVRTERETHIRIVEKGWRSIQFVWTVNGIQTPYRRVHAPYVHLISGT